MFVLKVAHRRTTIWLRWLRDNVLPPACVEMPVPRYFMHLRDGTEELLDPEGAEYDSMTQLRDRVLTTVRDLMAGDIQNGVLDFRFRIDAEDINGAIVYTLPFKHGVNVIPETAAA